MDCDHPPMIKYALMVQLHNILILLIITKEEKCIRRSKVAIASSV